MQKLNFCRTRKSFLQIKKNTKNNNQGSKMRDLWLILQLGDYHKEQRAKKA